MTEPTLWVGGQMSSQGVSAFDENQLIETTGATASYLDLRRRIRKHYAAFRKDRKFSAGAAIDPKTGPIGNPGGCWVSLLCFEPAPAEGILRSMLQPGIDAKRLHLRLHTVPVSVERDGRNLRSVLVYDFGASRWIRLKARYFVDASEMGDLLPMIGVRYRMGAESRAETLERDAPALEDRRAAQSFTYTFILEDPIHPIPAAAPPKPAGYGDLAGQYSLTVDYGNGKHLTYGFFDSRAGLPGSFWAYRRSVEADKFQEGAFAGDRAMINWSSNDDCDANLLSTDPVLQAAALQHAKRLSAGFAWWIQHEVPRDDRSGNGYPQLALMRDVMGSADGLSQQPYIRESRRIVPRQTIVEEDIAIDFQHGARAAQYRDSVGIGWYPIDIHSCGQKGFGSASRPFQIPLGALIPKDIDNLMAAGKDIGTTHITNGAYRLHPTEWSIGEAVGSTLAESMRSHKTPAQIDDDPEELDHLQQMLGSAGHPIFWYDDVSIGTRNFAAMQMAGVRSSIGVNGESLHGLPEQEMTGNEIADAVAKLYPHTDRVALDTLRPLRTVRWKDLRVAGMKIRDPLNATIVRGAFTQWLLDKPSGKKTARL
jgi:hypothetical protein